MKVFFAGTPQNAAETLRALKKSGVDVVGVLTRTDAPVGRKRELTASAVATEAQALGLPVIKSNTLDAATLSRIQALKPDLGLVVAYGAFLGPQALSALKLGWINLHYSLLPKYRGAAPVQHAILNGESETGVSIFQLDQGMDTGPVFISVPTVIEPGESAARLLQRLTNLGITALLELLPAIAAGIAKPTPQNDPDATFANKITRETAQIDWNKSALKIEHLVNAMNPEPVAWTILKQESFRIIDARVSHLEDSAEHESLSIGGIITRNDTVLAKCGTGYLELLVVQPAGKKLMQASEWLRGQQGKDALVFGS